MSNSLPIHIVSSFVTCTRISSVMWQHVRENRNNYISKTHFFNYGPPTGDYSTCGCITPWVEKFTIFSVQIKWVLMNFIDFLAVLFMQLADVLKEHTAPSSGWPWGAPQCSHSWECSSTGPAVSKLMPRNCCPQMALSTSSFHFQTLTYIQLSHVQWQPYTLQIKQIRNLPWESFPRCSCTVT